MCKGKGRENKEVDCTLLLPFSIDGCHQMLAEQLLKFYTYLHAYYTPSSCNLESPINYYLISKWKQFCMFYVLNYLLMFLLWEPKIKDKNTNFLTNILIVEAVFWTTKLVIGHMQNKGKFTRVSLAGGGANRNPNA